MRGNQNVFATSSSIKHVYYIFLSFITLNNILYYI